MKPARGQADKLRLRGERDKRRAAALRENLRKRKIQARVRAGGAARPPDEPPAR